MGRCHAATQKTGLVHVCGWQQCDGNFNSQLQLWGCRNACIHSRCCPCGLSNSSQRACRLQPRGRCSGCATATATISSAVAVACQHSCPGDGGGGAAGGTAAASGAAVPADVFAFSCISTVNLGLTSVPDGDGGGGASAFSAGCSTLLASPRGVACAARCSCCAACPSLPAAYNRRAEREARTRPTRRPRTRRVAPAGRRPRRDGRHGAGVAGPAVGVDPLPRPQGASRGARARPRAPSGRRRTRGAARRRRWGLRQGRGRAALVQLAGAPAAALADPAPQPGGPDHPTRRPLARRPLRRGRLGQ